MTEQIVNFNIGGQKYEVSRSLLQTYPNSMLATSASDQWQKNPEVAIFIEGDGIRFRYVLDYLRHGSVCLPTTESKEGLTKELEYYGIEVDENAIGEKMAITDLLEYTSKTHAEYRFAHFAFSTEILRLSRISKNWMLY